MKKGTLILGLCIMACFIMVAANTYAAQYDCTVYRVVTYDDGKVVVTIFPAAGEIGFVGPARVQFSTKKDGGKNMLATLLTAISMGTDVAINCADVPVNSPIRTVTSFGVFAE